jgi:hypothetical protein
MREQHSHEQRVGLHIQNASYIYCKNAFELLFFYTISHTSATLNLFILLSTGIFIFYLTHCANEFSKENKRSTISTQDVINALKELDFGDFEGPLVDFLEKYRAENASKQKSKKKEGEGDGDGDDDDGDDGN